MPRLLLVQPQLPHDPGNGAARTARGAAEFAAAAGWEVRGLASTGVDTWPDFDCGRAIEFLRRSGFEPELTGKVWRYQARGVEYRLIDAKDDPPSIWHPEREREFDLSYDETLAAWRPDLILTYRGSLGDLARHGRARAAGIRQIAAVFNQGYLFRSFFEPFQAVLTPSEFLAGVYRAAVGVKSTPLPTPIDPDEVLVPATEREPIFFTMVNPSIEKGAMFLARLAEELGKRRPDIPLLVIESRGKADALVAAGLAGGFDLRRHENLMFSPAVSRPRDFLASTRALLAPSVFAEPSARVVAEALVNGIPTLVSERGGLQESCGDGGFVLKLPEDLTLASSSPVGAEAVEEWLKVIERLADDEEFYLASSARAREAGRAYLPERLGPAYVGFFETVLAAPPDAPVFFARDVS